MAQERRLLRQLESESRILIHLRTPVKLPKETYYLESNTPRQFQARSVGGLGDSIAQAIANSPEFVFTEIIWA